MIKKGVYLLLVCLLSCLDLHSQNAEEKAYGAYKQLENLTYDAIASFCQHPYIHKNTLVVFETLEKISEPIHDICSMPVPDGAMDLYIKYTNLKFQIDCFIELLKEVYGYNSSGLNEEQMFFVVDCLKGMGWTEKVLGVECDNAYFIEYEYQEFKMLFIPINNLNNVIYEWISNYFVMQGGLRTLLICGDGYMYYDLQGGVTKLNLQEACDYIRNGMVDIIPSTSSGYRALDFPGLENILLIQGIVAGVTLQAIGRVARGSHMNIITLEPKIPKKIPVYTKGFEHRDEMIRGYYKYCIINDITIENPAPQPFTMAELMMYAAHKLKIPLQRIEKTIWDLYYNGYISIYSNPTILKTKYLKNILENLMVAGDDNILRLAKKALLSWAADSDKNISGIIPTMQRVDFVELKQDQAIILKMLSRRFLLGFYASNKYIERTINISCAGELFGYKQIQTIQQGWKLNNIGNDTIFKEVLPEEELFPKGPLSIQEKVKAAPKAYTLATLYSALCNANLLAENRKLHYYNFGIGTDYNRLTIINDLIHDGYLKFKNNTLSLADSLNDIWPYLPEELLNTDYTVYCEYTLEQVRKGEITANEYIKQRVPYIKKLATQQLKPGYQIQHKLCPVCSKGYLVLKSSKQDKFWGCTNFPECKASFANINSEPFIMACPECKTGYLKKRSKINEVFWCCSNYPACTYMASKLPNKKEE